MSGYKRSMKNKRETDRCGEHFQDAFTENESKARGADRESIQGTLKLDPNVDSEEGDRAMAENRFGVNQPKPQR